MSLSRVSAAFLLLPALAFGAFLDRTDQLTPGLGNGLAAWIDFDHDGFTDLSVGDKLWRNDGGSNFVASAGYGNGVWADFDNDSLPDVYAWDGGGKLHRNGGDAGFTLVPTPTLPMDTTGQKPSVSLGASWGDHNGDGYVDLYVGGYENWDPPADFPDAWLRNNAAASFTLEEGSTLRARGVTSCDFDEDGDIDVYVSNYRLQPNRLWSNDGSGSFSDVAGERGAAGDPGVSIPYGHTIGSAWGDLNNDGHIDLFVGNFRHNWGDGSQDHAKFLRNQGPSGNWHFELKRELAGSDWQESYASPAMADYDNDGDLDLYFTTVYGGDNARLYRNDGNWSFVDVTAEEGLAGMPATYQAAWADFNHDGFPDLVTGARLYENQGNSNHWLKVRLEGDGATVNRSAIGAQVRIDLGGGTILTRQVEAGTGQGNQNDLTLHFGLGTRNAPVDLDILWPGGGTQTVPGVKMNQTLTVSLEAKAGSSAGTTHAPAASVAPDDTDAAGK